MNSPRDKKPWAQLLQSARRESAPQVDLRRAVRQRLEQREPPVLEAILALFSGARGRWLAGASLATITAMAAIAFTSAPPALNQDPDQAFTEYLESGDIEALW